MRFVRLIKFIHYGSTLQKFTYPKLGGKKLYHKIMFPRMLSETMIILIENKHIILAYKIFYFNFLEVCIL